MTIEFWLDNSAAPPASMEYLPHGTRSLRVRVRTRTPLPAMRLRPRHTTAEDTAHGIFRGFEDGGTQFQLSWGGGQEDGPPARSEDKLGAFEQPAGLNPEHTPTIVFNLTHIGRDLPETAVLTLEAFEVETGVVRATLPVTLRRPAALPPALACMPLAQNGRWNFQAGSHLPVYETRWWPAETVTYTAAPATLPLSVQYDAATTSLQVQWNAAVIAIIEDHTTPSILNTDAVRCELFVFSESYVALRIWFFWLDVNIGHGFFIGRHEVPDAERFDLLIRLSDGTVGLACTDLHWRESWGVSTQSPQRATLGLSREAKVRLAQEGLKKIWDKVWDTKSAVAPAPYNPLGYIQRRAKLEARNTRFAVRATGTEAHIPMLQDLLSDSESMFSSDVRLG